MSDWRDCDTCTALDPRLMERGAALLGATVTVYRQAFHAHHNAYIAACVASGAAVVLCIPKSQRNKDQAGIRGFTPTAFIIDEALDLTEED